MLRNEQKKILDKQITKQSETNTKIEKENTYQGSFIMLKRNAIIDVSKARSSYFALISLPITRIILWILYHKSKARIINFKYARTKTKNIKKKNINKE
jgi:hypothetical protein